MKLQRQELSPAPLWPVTITLLFIQIIIKKNITQHQDKEATNHKPTILLLFFIIII